MMEQSNILKLRVRGISTDECKQIWQGGPDAYGQAVVVRAAEGAANPCRHCLGLIKEGDTKLVLAYRPFTSLQPYAETGPIFLHSEPCERYDSDALPAWFTFLDPAVIRGYGEDHWIRYDTGNIVRGPELTSTCHSILSDTTIAYVHIRSKFNCFQCRVDRG